MRDVMCEHCEARIRNALETLPGAGQVDRARTSRDEAEVMLTSGEAVEPSTITRVIEARSEGTTHTYVAVW